MLHSNRESPHQNKARSMLLGLQAGSHAAHEDEFAASPQQCGLAAMANQFLRSRR
jgi:hypothetical protein